MSKELATTEKKLPKLSDLIEEKALSKQFKNDELNLLLNQQPPQSWVKEHPYVRGHAYLPIDKVEFLLRRIFKQYRIEITGQGTAFNGVWVTVRVHFLNPVTDEWDYHDGIGSIQLQTQKGTSPADLSNINNGALSMAFPHAKTLAIKDACDMFGTLFGSNLNRRDTLGYQTDADLARKANKEKVDSEGLETLVKNLKADKISLDKINEMYDLTMEQMKELIEANK